MLKTLLPPTGGAAASAAPSAAGPPLASKAGDATATGASAPFLSATSLGDGLGWLGARPGSAESARVRRGGGAAAWVSSGARTHAPPTTQCVPT